MPRSLLAILLLFAAPAFANDGFGGLTATGLTFGQTAAVAMEQEDLFIGPDRIRVDYVFRNTSAQDVSGEVIFPLPPIPLQDLENEDWNLPEDRSRENLVNFTATVEGKPIPVAIDRLAVIEPENAWEQPAATRYDTPGKDVTARLAAYDLPLTIDLDTLHAKLNALPPTARAAMIAEGLAAEIDPSDPTQGLFPLWSIVLRYHWPQVFPAGTALHISHAYENHPSGGLFVWQQPPEGYSLDLQKQYCVDAGTSKAIMKAITYRDTDGTMQSIGTALYIAYVLRTANSWAGPIGHFRLTLDKGDVRNVISLCAQGVKKTGPTTFVVERTNYAPDRDLDILIVSPPQR
ncbi:MAG: DUF4424 domain-containing protein [Rhodobacteraceae bacterium]|nr:DUF4424 domain-containing protein [Paracoccaceae bacterium]